MPRRDDTDDAKARRAGLRILCANGAAHLAHTLNDALRSVSGLSVTILMVSKGLDDDPERNSIVQEALSELAAQRLVIVCLDDAEPPLGLRDVSRIDWRSDLKSSTASLISKIRSMPNARKGGFRQMLAWAGALLALLAVISFPYVVANRNRVAEERAHPGPTTAGVGAPDVSSSPYALSPGGRLSVQRAFGPTVAQDADIAVGEERADIVALGFELRRSLVGDAQVEPSQHELSLPPGEHWVTATCSSPCRLLLNGQSIMSDTTIARAPLTRTPAFYVVNADAVDLRYLAVVQTACPRGAACRYSIDTYSPDYTVSVDASRVAGQLAALRLELLELQAQLHRVEETNRSSAVAAFAAPSPAPRTVWPFALSAALLGIVSLIGLAFAIRVYTQRRRTLVATARGTHPHEVHAGRMVFASYARKDHDFVDRLIADLQKKGVEVWVDRVRLKGGSTWSKEIVQAIRQSKGLVLFCSPSAFQSDHVLREVCLADTYKKPVYPLMLEPVGIPDSFLYYLSTRQIIDLGNDPEWPEKMAQLFDPAPDALST